MELLNDSFEPLQTIRLAPSSLLLRATDLIPKGLAISTLPYNLDPTVRTTVKHCLRELK